MSILNFLLSPLLNEHGYTTLPTAQTAAGKPVTTGIFANIKASLDSFNDGTGMADGVILNRHLFNSNFYLLTGELDTPTAAKINDMGWYTNGTAFNTVYVNNIQETSPTIATVNSAVYKDILLKVASTRRMRFVATLSRPAIATAEVYGFGFLPIGGNLNPGTAGTIGVQWNGSGAAGAIKTVVRDDTNTAAAQSTLVASPTLSLDYTFIIDVTSTAVYFYVNGALTATITTNIPSTTVIKPYFIGSSSAGDNFYFKELKLFLGN